MYVNFWNILIYYKFNRLFVCDLIYVFMFLVLLTKDEKYIRSIFAIVTSLKQWISHVLKEILHYFMRVIKKLLMAYLRK